MSDFAEARARKALADAGLDYAIPLTRASSVTNEVWLTDDYAIRVNRKPNQRLRREAFLGPLLPPAVHYPEVVGYGGQLGADWLIVRRRPGEVLARCWPSMSTGERRSATRQLATILRNLHAVERPVDLPAIDAAPQLLADHEFGVTRPLLDALEGLRGVPFVETDLVEEALTIVRDTAACLEPFDTGHLVHGDVTFENVLWDGTAISALLDFEWARGGPADLDLDVLLRFCAYPFLHVAEDYEAETLSSDYAPVPYWLAEDYPELFAHPRQLDRMRLFCIAFDVRQIVAFPPQAAAKSLSPHHAVNRLERAVRGTSHLDRLADGLDPELPWDFSPAVWAPLAPR
ncbi:MAG: aminoglycoside phosphotransferase family protein [Acidimicrobiales bacterium]|jgi:aminoglycoside phosphotransferase (APT) family kinase protein|nr:aminoglycoside phosphotransferase family protein [Acidimicrobiales bacterium]